MTARQSTLGRLIHGLSGHAVMRVAILAQSIALVPILISRWGVDGYGAWIALTALGSYVGLTNFGIVDASGSAMLLATGAGDGARARRVFGSTVATLALVAAPVFGLTGAVALFAPLRDWLKLAAFDATDVSIVLLMVAIQVWCNMMRGAFAAAIATTGRFGLSNMTSACWKLAEIAGIACAVLYFNQGIAVAGYCIALAAIGDLLIAVGITWRLADWVKGTALRVDRTILSELARPSLGNVVLQFGVNGVVVQGPRVLLSALIGPAAVGVFAVHLTAARLTQQIVSMLAGPMMLEMSLAVGSGDQERAARLLVGGSQATALMGLSTMVVAAVAAHWLIPVWSAHTVSFLPLLFAVAGLAVTFNNTGSISLGVLLATNRIFEPALLMLAAGIGGIAVGAALSPAFGAVGMATGAAIAELLFLAICVTGASRIVGTPLTALVLRFLSPHDALTFIGQILRRFPLLAKPKPPA
ncbi:MAG: lipopolysaccharide biosynthesis protein [Pseudomonadota bacterium]